MVTITVVTAALGVARAAPGEAREKSDRESSALGGSEESAHGNCLGAASGGRENQAGDEVPSVVRCQRRVPTPVPAACGPGVAKEKAWGTERRSGFSGSGLGGPPGSRWTASTPLLVSRNGGPCALPAADHVTPARAESETGKDSPHEVRRGIPGPRGGLQTACPHQRRSSPSIF